MPGAKSKSTQIEGLEQLLKEFNACGTDNEAKAVNGRVAGKGSDAAGKARGPAQKRVPVELSRLTPQTLGPQDNSRFRLLGDWAAVAHTIQTAPPSVPVHLLHPDGKFPVGVVSEYASRPVDDATRERDRMYDLDVQNARRAAEVHRQVRKYVQSWIQPGMTFTDIVKRLEAKTEELVDADGVKAGKGFPTGISVNHCAAHWTPNPGDTTVLKQDDIVKLDFGVQVGGRIIDSAFTVAFNPRYDELIKATQEGTNVGIKEAGIDARFSEIGGAIQEAIEAHQVEIEGKVYDVKPIRNLHGHTIGPYMIHGGKSVPMVKNSDSTRMEEGEFYAIETFASTGKGYVNDDVDCSHYMKTDQPMSSAQLRVKGAKQLLHAIDTNFSTLAFCRRWLDDLGQTRHLLALKNLVDVGIVNPYPPLVDVRGCYTSQMEHTLVLRPTCKEVLSRGDDY